MVIEYGVVRVRFILVLVVAVGTIVDGVVGVVPAAIVSVVRVLAISVHVAARNLFAFAWCGVRAL